MLTQDRLKDLLHYDPDTGVFTWRVATNRRVRVGAVAGCRNEKGYIRIRIDGRNYRAHRLAFLYVNGTFPPADVDHIDRRPSNNRWDNLRPATRSDNNKNIRINSNNTSGWKGVIWNKRDRKWVAQAKLNGRFRSLGYYTTPEEASDAYEAFARKHHGEFYHDTRTSRETT